MRQVLTAVIVVMAAAGSFDAAQDRPSKPERELARDLDRIFTAPVMSQALWGVEVKSLDSGRVLYARNARTLMMPASNMKIVTLAAAAETLGWDYRFKTRLESPGDVVDGVLRGDLFIVGTGDPTINKRENRADAVFDEWAAALKAAGITGINGNVIGDATAFDSRGLGQGWSWDYLQDGYAAPSSALEFNENLATIVIRPGARPGDEATMELAPSTGLGLVRRVVTGEPGSRTRIDIERPPIGAWLEVTGSIAADAQPVSRDVAVAKPAIYFAHALTLALTARGIPIRGVPREVEATWNTLESPPRTVLVESQSPPLRDIAQTMMKVSQNLYAETLLKAVGAAKGGAGSAEAGRRASNEVFTRWGIPAGSYVQADGSGLSRYDFVTAEMIVTLLERLHKDERHRDRFVASLPIAGKDGTISTRMRGTRAEANAAAKTGSISNVRALSGYVKTRDGETLAFSILANAFTIPAATVNYITDVAVETLSNYSAR